MKFLFGGENMRKKDLNKNKYDNSSIIKEGDKLALDWRKVFSIAFIIVGIYYITISFNLVSSANVVIPIANIILTRKQAMALGIVLGVVGLILNRDFWGRVKSYF